MLRALYIHCGSDKTGSTSIQQTLANARAELEQAGILYPVLGGRADHTPLLLSLTDDDEITEAFGRGDAEGVEKSKAAAEDLWQKLAAEIAGSQAETLLLSSEYIYSLRPASLDRLVARLAPLAEDLRAVLYLRDPVEYYVSSSQQVLKFGANLPDPGAGLRYRARVGALRAAFGDRLQLRAFARDRLTGGDVVTDLLDVVTGGGATLPDLERRTENLSLPAEAMALLQEFNRSVWGDARISGNPENSRLIETLSAVALPDAAAKPVLQPWAREQVIRANAADMVWLADDEKFGFHSYDYDLARAVVAEGQGDGAAAAGPLAVQDVFTVDPAGLAELRSQALHALVGAGLKAGDELTRAQREKDTVAASLAAAEDRLDQSRRAAAEAAERAAASETRAADAEEQAKASGRALDEARRTADILDEKSRALEKKNAQGAKRIAELKEQASSATARAAQSEIQLNERNRALAKSAHKIRRLRKQRLWLGLPIFLLLLPLSLPLFIYGWWRREQKKKLASPAQRIRDEIAAEAPPPMPAPLAVPKAPDSRKQAPVTQAAKSAPVLIWCPIAVAGLTTQLVQLTAILRRLGVAYDICYHVPPKIDHPECRHWIDFNRINRPKAVFYMERYVPFENGFEEALQVFYVNLDWLKAEAVAKARVHADIVLCPVKHRFDELAMTFANAKTVQLPWPVSTAIAPNRPKQLDDPASDAPIRVLYVGNDYDGKSRKSPFATVEAILACDRTDLVFDLKFRNPLPESVKAQLAARPNVDTVIDRSVPAAEVEALYEKADVNLIPNETEGNGLSIIESFAKGVVPAVLDGYPMKDVVSEENGYRIACFESGYKELAPNYVTDTPSIAAFLSRLDRDGVRRRRQTIIAMEDSLHKRQTDLEDLVESVLLSSGVIAEVPSATTAEGEAVARKPELRDIFAQPRFDCYRPCEHIDVYLTTSRRADLLEPTLEHLVAAIEASAFSHRLFLAVDSLDPDTDRVLQRFAEQIDEVGWTRNQMGLPYHWNGILDRSRATIARSEIRPDFICYLQDDCLIQRPDSYFGEMVEAAEMVNPGRLGFVSGYHSDVHKGFEEITHGGRTYLLSDSIDGKNFMARPKLLQSIGKLTWWFPDGQRRGNPGPVRGSHFDLWQWKESPNCLMRQNRVSVVIPGLCEHTAAEKEKSTWANDTTKEAIERRVAEGKVYVTR
ncbi:MAG: hypothetical protein KDA73_10725 [Rhodobacteraceae bacterium]|nr:hypothetical protein [Paracoccaceae bacterium]